MTPEQINKAIAEKCGWTNIVNTNTMACGGIWRGYPPSNQIIGKKELVCYGLKKTGGKEMTTQREKDEQAFSAYEYSENANGKFLSNKSTCNAALDYCRRMEVEPLQKRIETLEKFNNADQGRNT